jgi:uncharacterized membrane protein
VAELNYNPAEHPRTVTDRAFRISLYLKGLDGLLETLGGILLLVIKPAQINHFAHWLTQGELSENSHDFIADHILKTAHNLTGASLIFGAVYLLSHGLVKIYLVFEVLRDHLWAYLALITVTALFVVYQVYRIVAIKRDGKTLKSALFFVVLVFVIIVLDRRRRVV